MSDFLPLGLHRTIPQCFSFPHDVEVFSKETLGINVNGNAMRFVRRICIKKSSTTNPFVGAEQFDRHFALCVLTKRGIENNRCGERIVKRNRFAMSPPIVTPDFRGC